jgi:hypothetical protein
MSAFLAELKLAEQRIGRTPEQRLRWLLKFLEEDLDLLRPEERIAKGYDLRALMDLSFGLRTAAKKPSRPGEAMLGNSAPMPDAELRAFQAEIAQGIRGLLQNPPQGWHLTTPQLSVWPASPGVKRGGFGLRWYGEEKDAILGGVVNLLLQAGEHLRACVECHRPFVARKRQIYCSAPCSQRVRDRRKRQRMATGEM